MYNKEFTRDFSIIMEEAWYYALSSGLWKKLGVAAPDGWPNIYYINKGVIEVWVDLDYIRKIMQAVYDKQEDTKFFEELFKEYETLNITLNNPATEDKDYFDTLFDAVSIFSIFWYGIQEDRIRPGLKKEFIALRDKDTIYDTCDKITRSRIARKFPMLKSELTTVLLKEFYNGLPTKTDLVRRLDNFVLVPNEIMQITKLEDFSRKQKIELEIFMKPKDGIVKGTTAYGGYVRGYARIIRRKDEVEKMKAGEILISPMTTPDVFSAMHKASAIVTDEGGMLCHAAIISRELKIPCIIGTKVASITYLDGELLEVDATNGTVKRILGELR